MRNKTIILVLALALLIGAGGISTAHAKVRIEVKTILAAQGKKHVDPKLVSIVRELKSVFRYSSYKLLKGSRLSLNINQTGKVNLPGNRVLRITPIKIKGNRVELQIVISRKKQQVLNTRVKLRSGSSITLGGPKYKGGNLLFNISGSF